MPLTVQGRQDVLKDAALLEHAGALEGTNEADLCEFVGGKATQGRLPVNDLAARLGQEDCDDVEGRGLAGAVWTNEAYNLTLPDRERHVGYRQQPAEAHSDVFDRQHGVGG